MSIRKPLSAEEKIAKVRDLRPIDDVFFEVLVQRPGVCEEMLRVILDDRDLVVEDVISQSSERNIYGRSVRLDALCILGSGERVNIEVQRADNDDHLRRARFNAASITVKDSNPRDRFRDIVQVCIVYISEHDFLKGGLTAYHIDKVIRETGQAVDDGLEEVFVNAEVNDGTDLAGLMSCFKQKDVSDSRFPAMSRAVSHLKYTEGGASTVCKVMEQYENEARDESKVDDIKSLMKTLKLTAEKAMDALQIPQEDRAKYVKMM